LNNTSLKVNQINKAVIPTVLGWVIFFIALAVSPILIAGLAGGVVYVIAFSILNSDQVATDLEALADIEKFTRGLSEVKDLDVNTHTSGKKPMSTKELRVLLESSLDASPTAEYQQTAYAFRLMKTDYLKSTAWDTKRKAVLKRDKYVCQQCGATDVALDVHHMADYILIPHEPITSLITLCRECHDNEHLLHGYPSSYSDYAEWDHRIY